MNSPFLSALPVLKKQVEEKQQDPPKLPASANYAWSYFLRLNQTRQSSGLGGFSFISYQEMLAYFTLERIAPEPYELELIRVWDGIACEHYQSKTKDK